MKTTNLTPWCNLFSTASKYNIEVKQSRYKLFIIAGLSLLALLLALVFFSYAYHLALALAGFCVLVLSLLFTRKSHRKQRVLYQFELQVNGLCSFSGDKKWQLQQASRLSFLGCWLVLIPFSVNNTLLLPQQKQVFIFKDSLSAQDFSRLTFVLKNLSSKL